MHGADDALVREAVGALGWDADVTVQSPRCLAAGARCLGEKYLPRKIR